MNFFTSVRISIQSSGSILGMNGSKASLASALIFAALLATAQESSAQGLNTGFDQSYWRKVRSAKGIPDPSSAVISNDSTRAETASEEVMPQPSPGVPVANPPLATDSPAVCTELREELAESQCTYSTICRAPLGRCTTAQLACSSRSCIVANRIARPRRIRISDRVNPRLLASPDSGAAAEVPTATSNLTAVAHSDLPGNDYAYPPVTSGQQCLDACAADARCRAYTFRINPPYCWLKNAVGTSHSLSGFYSGVKVFAVPHGTVVISDTVNPRLLALPNTPATQGCQQGTPEVCGDHIDNNCNGIVDEGCSPVSGAAVAVPTATSNLTAVAHSDLPGNDYTYPPVTSGQQCLDACAADARCRAYTFRINPPYCWLKNAVGTSHSLSGFYSGVKVASQSVPRAVAVPVGTAATTPLGTVVGVVSVAYPASNASAPLGCQQLSDQYGTYRGHWANLNPSTNEGQLWGRLNCTTVPATAKSCQQLSDEYGTFHGNWARLSSSSLDGLLWTARNCATFPATAKSCQQLSDEYGTYPGNWARLSNTSPDGLLWTSRSCTTHPLAPQPDFVSTRCVKDTGAFKQNANECAVHTVINGRCRPGSQYQHVPNTDKCIVGLRRVTAAGIPGPKCLDLFGTLVSEACRHLRDFSYAAE
jgi:hypothetical protein